MQFKAKDLLNYIYIYFFTYSCRDDNSSNGHTLLEQLKYVVFKSCLWQLFETCPVCLAACTVKVQYMKGSMMVVRQQCPRCDYERTWSSQPMVGNMPAGNILLSGAILFCGASYTKVLSVLNSMHAATISPRTFQDHATIYLQPTIWQGWITEKDYLFEKLHGMGEKVYLGGDGRADSPGHTAKYMSYTMIELRLNKIVDLQLVQVIQYNSLDFIIVRLTILYMKQTQLENQHFSFVTAQRCGRKCIHGEGRPDTERHQLQGGQLCHCRTDHRSPSCCAEVGSGEPHRNQAQLWCMACFKR